jgi:hypothetical protein
MAAVRWQYVPALFISRSEGFLNPNYKLMTLEVKYFWENSWSYNEDYSKID